MPARDVGEFVRHLQSNPGKLNYGMPTSSSLLAMEMFKLRTRTEMVGVPYKGSAPTSIALLANEVQAAVDVAGVYKAHVDAGKVRPLLVTSSQRSPLYPSTPTADELGLPELTLNVMGGFWIRPGAPRPQVERLAAAVAEILALPETRARFTQIGWLVTPGSADTLRRNVAAEIDQWATAARAAGYKPE